MSRTHTHNLTSLRSDVGPMSIEVKYSEENGMRYTAGVDDPDEAARCQTLNAVTVRKATPAQ